ncbi:MAG TPA: DNA double-strand break repair nuclease NurA [Nitrosopumilaceae archaeon]|nr:DNA double-strand break repair nuclease NurA [Nitrosopumilaceae archaeon]
MLNTVYKDAIQRREKTLSMIRGPKFDQIIQKAKQNWTEYLPQKKEASTAGIDSSFNSTKFQGMELWVVTAVSVESDGRIIKDLHDHGLGYPDIDLSSMASRMEIEACNASIDEADLVLMDGSLYSQFMTRQSTLSSTLLKIMTKKENVIFVSKTSNTRMQFADMDSTAGDIFYYNHATQKPGFSKLFLDPKYGSDKIIASVFARLNEYTPLIKLEFLGKDHSEDEIKTVLDKLYKNSVGGYPYALKLAHNNCKISNNDLLKLVSLYGLKTEVGSREVLE